MYRAGLFELPLAQSPGQRLDDLAGYGYYGTHVGLNDLPLSSPRWGVQAERQIGAIQTDLTLAFGEYKGSAYGGKPVPTGETTNAQTPELGLFLRAPVTSGIDIGGTFSPARAASYPTGETRLPIPIAVTDAGAREHSTI
ncbi:MAG: hypothetical protein ACXWNK_15235 [Vulcanimicrobiaceae bacterium]